jgi:hypothetical protein
VSSGLLPSLDKYDLNISQGAANFNWTPEKPMLE